MKVFDDTYIEGQTPLDSEEKLDLIPDILYRKDLDLFEQENILQARKWLMQKTVLSRQNIISEEFIKKLHRKMYGNVWKWAGKYRKTNKNIGVEAYLISTSIAQLIADTEYQIIHKTYTIEDFAIIFHHRLVKIHLFPNGNGRHARLMADAYCAKYNGSKLLWGKDELISPNENRKKYILSLREADKGNYEPLLEFARGV